MAVGFEICSEEGNQISLFCGHQNNIQKCLVLQKEIEIRKGLLNDLTKKETSKNNGITNRQQTVKKNII